MLPQFTARRLRPVTRFVLLALVIGATWRTALAETPTTDWPQFHGPSGMGIIEGTLPESWNDDDYAWTISLSGTDVGSPVIVDGTVYLIETASAAANGGSGKSNQNSKSNQTSKSIDLVALDLQTGREQWRRKHPLVDRGRHSRNSAASTTPVVSGDQVFFVYCDAEGVYVQAYRTDSTPLWSRDLGPWSGVHGYGTSPMVVQDKLVLFNAQQAL